VPAPRIGGPAHDDLRRFAEQVSRAVADGDVAHAACAAAGTLLQAGWAALVPVGTTPDSPPGLAVRRASVGTERVLYVGRRGPGAWSRGAVATLEEMARLLDLALRVEDVLAEERRLRHHQAAATETLRATLEQRQRVLAEMVSVQRAMARRAPLQQKLDLVTDAVARVLGVELVGIRLVDESRTGELVLVSGHGLDPAEAGGTAYRSNTTVCVDDDGVLAAVGVPVQQLGRAVGSIVAATTTPGRRFGESEQETLRAFADQASIALTEHHLFEEMQQGYTDPLTGLANRALLQDQLTAAVELAGTGPAGPAVLFVDLDGFKLVNDTLGHAIGDELLGKVADRLRGVVEAPAVVGRFGGDEFLVLLPSVADVREATEVAERLLACLTQPLEVAEHDVSVSASIGIAWSRHGCELAGTAAAATVDLLRRADTAMYRAKGLGRGRYAVFQDAMYDELVRALDREAQLRQALEDDAMTAQFQPVVDLATGRAVGAEALVRWSRDGELVPPAEFIDLAEETGLILSLGRQVLRRAFEAAAALRRAGAGPLTMSVNLSVRQLESPTLADDLTHEMFRAGISPGDIVVELTESALMRDVTAMTERLATLRALGVRIALDDFGTGYSSLARLRWLPLDILKIDRSFVDQVDTDPLSRAMAATVLGLAEALDLDVVAEGVERESQRVALLELGVRVGQGWLFARPMDADALTAHVVAEMAVANG